MRYPIYFNAFNSGNYIELNELKINIDDFRDILQKFNSNSQYNNIFEYKDIIVNLDFSLKHCIIFDFAIKHVCNIIYYYNLYINKHMASRIVNLNGTFISENIQNKLNKNINYLNKNINNIIKYFIINKIL